ncbi:winged helix-turn-helix domain-containing protein [Granulicella sp. WH15]|uniref:winged helix-turn-helix domain-containing protein n=1 Tax=Granulicella sp. WH15 TaxID=2602070 RepID=UPI001366E2C6|nr:winged helix-turn-helix domain-containing protein [Granulicella sp. WH15]QHN02906.1 winged helix-turn-helix domain-containing protein [Granulicella sp. WH15]
MAILERFEEINEQHIGVAVFGRSPDYDSAADSIVRSHATRLRQKLEQYFRGEGRHEPLRIEIPRGGYVPRFYPGASTDSAQTLTSSPAPSVAPSEPDLPASDTTKPHEAWPAAPLTFEEPAPSGKRIFGSRSIVLLSVLTTLLAGGLLLGMVRHLRRDAMLAAGRASNSQSPIERRFWDTLFSANGKTRTIIVSGDNGLSLYETITGHEVSLEDYLDGDYQNPDRIRGIRSEASVDLTLDISSRRYTSFVDADLAEQLSHLPQWTPTNAGTVFARDLRAADAATSNLILLGSRQENPWISLAESSLNFVLVPDGKRGFQYLNRNPRAGEISIYGYKDNHGNFGAANVYGDVAYLPNPGGQGMILVLSGMWISGTQSAGRFVLDSARFSAWLKSIANPDGTIPPFELLLATQSLQGNATYTSIIAKRVRGK